MVSGTKESVKVMRTIPFSLKQSQDPDLYGNFMLTVGGLLIFF